MHGMLKSPFRSRKVNKRQRTSSNLFFKSYRSADVITGTRLQGIGSLVSGKITFRAFIVLARQKRKHGRKSQYQLLHKLNICIKLKKMPVIQCSAANRA